MQKSFSFKGLTYNSDNLLVADGECMELVNLRYRDGVLSPIVTDENETELESIYGRVYWHPAAEMFLAIEMADEHAVHFYDKNLRIVTNSTNCDALMLFPLLKGVERIEFAGNIVCCIAANTTYYLFYNSGSYCWLGEQPPMPNLTFSLNSIVYSLSTEGEYLLVASLDNISDPLYWGNASSGFFDECLAALHSKGYFVDRALFRFAFRLFDGNYLYYSPIYYVDDDNSVSGLSRDKGNFISEAIDGGATAGSSKYRVKIQGFKPTFHFAGINLKNWENIIVGIDLFTTGSIYGHKLSDVAENWVQRNGLYYSRERGVMRYIKKSNSELLADVADATLFYKIAEYNIDGVLVDSVDDVSKTNLALCDSLPDDSGSALKRSATASYQFNGRLHLAGLREVLFKGYMPYDYLPAALEQRLANYAMVVTRIKTTMGVSVVKKEYNGTFVLGYKDGAYYLTPYIMYPDSRACEMEFIIKIGSAVYRKPFRLTPHKTLNIAAYIHSYGNGDTVTLVGGLSNGAEPVLLLPEEIKAFFSYKTGEYVVAYVSGEGWFYGDRKFALAVESANTVTYRKFMETLNPADGDTVTIIIERGDELNNLLDVRDIVIDATWENIAQIPLVEEVNACEVRGNVMKVSAVDNPLFFPAKNTYTPSHEDILALCSNTVALSQGQFGQYPLYLFCKDGIWAMAGDTSGSIAYATARPVSREVCINPGSLCCIDSGVAFVSNRGLMLLQGGKLTCLSASLDCNTMPIKDALPSTLFRKIAELSGNSSAMGSTLFKDYAYGAVVGFVAGEKELWVSNIKYGYSYVYSLENNYWTKINASYTCFTNYYPHLLANRPIDGKSHVSLLDRSIATGYARVLLVTRPQLWGSKLPKRIMQFMLHAAVRLASEAVTGYRGVGCYLLCSNDGIHYKLLSGVEKNEDFNDVVFPFFPSQSYKYYVVAFTGSMAAESKIIGAELSMEYVWNNRLR